jgi:hypothetical protein
MGCSISFSQYPSRVLERIFLCHRTRRITIE